MFCVEVCYFCLQFSVKLKVICCMVSRSQEYAFVHKSQFQTLCALDI